jgi:hypothetical protein
MRRLLVTLTLILALPLLTPSSRCPFQAHAQQACFEGQTMGNCVEIEKQPARHGATSKRNHPFEGQPTDLGASVGILALIFLLWTLRR